MNEPNSDIVLGVSHSYKYRLRRDLKLCRGEKTKAEMLNASAPSCCTRKLCQSNRGHLCYRTVMEMKYCVPFEVWLEKFSWVQALGGRTQEKIVFIKPRKYKQASTIVE
jgi:hypothetical protein